MTPEQEQVLFTALGRIEQKLDNCVSTLSSHTVQDSENFLKLEEQMNDIRDRQIREVENKIEAINLLAAEKKGADEALAKAAASSGGKMGGFVATVVSIVIAGFSAYFNAR
jgi:hypothetical protein